MTKSTIIEVEGLENILQDQVIHRDLHLRVREGEILAIIGGSGSGKTTLLRSLLMLLRPVSGAIRIFDQSITDLSLQEENRLKHRFGVLFQHSALFSSMHVLDNVMFPMREFSKLREPFMRELAMLKIALVGLSSEALFKAPSELSGGMQRRVAMARAIAMDPDILFLDEPTTGLDPRSARQFSELVLFLRDALGLTIVIVSHDVELLKIDADRIAFIGDKKVLDVAPLSELMKSTQPQIQAYFKDLT